MRSKTVIGVIAILAIIAGVLIISIGARNDSRFYPSTPNPASTSTATHTPSPTATASITPSPTPWYAGDLGLGTVSGRVFDSLTGAPISGAIVTCQHFSYFPRALCSEATATTSDGNFVFKDIFFHDTDSITLLVEVPGYDPESLQSAFFTFPGWVAEVTMQPSSPADGSLTPTPAFMIICTPPPCAIGAGEIYQCPSGHCPGGCGTTCATYTPAP